MVWTILAGLFTLNGFFRDDLASAGAGILFAVLGVRSAVMRWDKPGAFVNAVVTVVAVLMLFNQFGDDEEETQEVAERPAQQASSAESAEGIVATEPPKAGRAQAPTRPSIPPTLSKTAEEYQAEGLKSGFDWIVRDFDFGLKKGERIQGEGPWSKEVIFQDVLHEQCTLQISGSTTDFDVLVEVRRFNDDDEWFDYQQLVESVGEDVRFTIHKLRVKVVRGVVEHLYSTRWCAPERGKLAQGPTTTANQDVKPVVFPTQGSGEIPLNAWSEQILSSDKCRLQFVKTGVFELDLEEEKTTNGWLISVRIISGAPEGLGYICR